MSFGLEITTTDGIKTTVDANSVYITNNVIVIDTSAVNGSYWIPNYHIDTHDLIVTSESGFLPVWYIQNGNQFVWNNYNGFGYQARLMPLRKTY